MKARVLSLVLLLAMLITAAPVVISAAEVEKDEATVLPDDGKNTADLHGYYVQEGLVALFSGFDSESVDFKNGIWQNKVKDGEDATFRDAATPYWELQNGGIGYTMLPAEWDADAQMVGISLSDSYEDLDDYTVEAFATVVGITDENGDRFVNHYQAAVKDEAGNVITPASGRQYGWYKSGAKASSAFRFGLVYSLFFCSLMDNPAANDSIGSRWMICNYGYVDGQPSGDKGYVIINEAGWRKMGTPTVPAAGTMQVYKKTATDAETSVTSVNHRLTYNGGSNVFNETFTKEQEAIYLSQSRTDLSSRFSLFNDIPSTVYSIRVYDRELTAAEIKHNRAVDVMLYYGLEIPASVAEYIEDYLCAQFATVAFLTYGSAEYDAKKAELQATVDWRVGAEEIISLYAQRDHMTSFFTTYYDGTLDMTAGTWGDLVANGAAKMGTPSRWFKNADGSFGYNAFTGYVMADGTQAMNTTVTNDYSSINALGNVPTANHVYWKNNELTFGIDKMPADDFTFEYMAMYRPLLVADASKSTKDNLVYATDADGNLLEAYKVFGATPATTDYGSVGGKAVDVIGHFTTITQQIDSTSGWGNSVRGTQHWMYDTFKWSNTRNWVGSGGGWGATSGLAVSGDPFKKNDVINVYAITLDETVTADAATGNFGLYRNGNLYKENKGGFSWASESGAYNPELTASCQFYLSCCQPINFYGARVYDVVLTEAEKKQNVAIDVILYYGLDISSVRDDADAMASLYNLLSAETFLTDAAAKAARAAYLQFQIDGEALASDMAGKYVAQENLTALFTTFVPGSINMLTGKWTDLVGGKTASLGNISKGYWQLGDNGSIGFNIYYGTVDAEGNYSATSPYNNYDVNGTRLEFGIDMLPKGDFTVEYTAEYHPVYVADANGNIAKSTGSVITPDGTVSIAAGAPIETVLVNSIYSNGVFHSYNTPGSQQYGSISAGPIDQLGYIQSWNTNRDGKFTSTGTRGAVHWTIHYPTATGNNLWGNVQHTQCLYVNGDIFQTRDVIRTFAITRAKSTDATTGIVTATYQLRRDSVAYATQSKCRTDYETNNGNNASGITTDFAVEDPGYFYLSERISTEFYTVRIYNKVLTAEEQNYNRAVDVIYYYGLDVSDEMWADADVMETLTAKIYGTAFLTEAEAKAEKKAELQAIVDGCALGMEMRELYAAPEHMTHLYTTFAPDSVNLTSGKWADLLSASNADLGGAYHWKNGEYGGIGFNTFRGNMEDTDGDGYKETFNKDILTGQNYNSTALVLNFGIAQLPTSDFTVEYLAMYKPVYVYDADNTADHIARDKDGNKIEVFTYDKESEANTSLTGITAEYVDRFGWFTSYSTAIDSVATWGGYNATQREERRGMIFWQFDNTNWYDGHNGQSIGANFWNETIMDKKNNVFQQNNAVNAYSISLDETLTVAEDGTRTTTGLFSLYRNASLFASNASDLNSTDRNGTGKGSSDINDGGYFDIDTEWTGGQGFLLSCRRPTDFFGVRIYDVALTDDEKAQNLFVDMLYYYGIEIPEKLKGDSETLIKLGKANASIGFKTNAADKAAAKALVEAAIDGAFKTVTVQVGSETVDSFDVVEDKLTLPTVVDGKLAIGWKVNGAAENVAPGTEIDVTDDVALEPTLFTVPETRLAPTVKVAASADDLAIRFTAELYRADYLALRALYGKENVHIGMLITPDYYVQKAGGVFTREALTQMVQSEGSASGAAYIQIDADGFYTVGQKVLTISGSVYNFSKSTFDNNPAFAAVAFLDVDTDGDGVIDLTFYGNYNPNASATVKENMMKAQASMTDTQKGWIDSLLSRFGA